MRRAAVYQNQVQNNTDVQTWLVQSEPYLRQQARDHGVEPEMIKAVVLHNLRSRSFRPSDKAADNGKDGGGRLGGVIRDAAVWLGEVKTQLEKQGRVDPTGRRVLQSYARQHSNEPEFDGDRLQWTYAHIKTGKLLNPSDIIGVSAAKSNAPVGENAGGIFAKNERPTSTLRSGDGDVDEKPTQLDQVAPWLGGGKKPAMTMGLSHMGENRWFEKRYAGWLAHSKEVYTKEIDDWIQNGGGKKTFYGPTTRQNIRPFYSGPGLSATAPRTGLPRQNEQDYGDAGQNDIEADQVLGNFSIDLKTPVHVEYHKGEDGKITYEWNAPLYVHDTLGTQEKDPIYPVAKHVAPSQQVYRAVWVLSGSGSYRPQEKAK